MVTKTRVRTVAAPETYYKFWAGATPTKVNLPSSTYTDTLVYSQGNPGPPYRKGGGFDVIHDITDYGAVRVAGRNPTNAEYWGAMTASLPPNGSFSFPADQTTTLFGLGSKAYSLARPDRPVASVAQMIGEMKDFLGSGGAPSKRGWNPAKDAAKDFLGYEFGAKPFINDLKALQQLQSKLAKKLAFLHNNNGKSIRRSIDLGNFVDSYQTVQNGGVWVSGTALLQGAYNRTNVYTSEKKYWYSGKFKFFVPELQLPVGSWPKSLAWAQALGAKDAKLLYELTPWSWLVDWFGTLGDALGNLSNFGVDNIVQEYGFVMGSHRVESRAINPVMVYDWNAKARPITIISRRVYERKQRVVGLPYGFGANPQPLSLRQGAILAALGLSRL